MRITFLLARRVPDVPSPVLQVVAALLTAAGHQVDGWIPEDRLLRADRFLPDADLYLLKSHTELALSLAGVLHHQGLPILNPYPACVRAQDKVTASQALRAAGVMAPETWLTGDLSLAAPLLEAGPVVVKPHRGHRGVGVHIVRSTAQLQSLPEPAEPVVVQRYVPGPGEDLKVYVAGDHVHAVRKRFSGDSFTRPGRPVPVTDAVRDLARRVRSAFGLELFGVDVIESPQGPIPVDVNYFPGYKGCEAGVAAQIATVIQEQVRHALGAEVGG
ncbi:RimK family alpha-L-glutamate ligase [Arthrobacter sp. GCM10027362]|uniref:ATP-grasp domain-containing protein n=1 Tax=Arthrobacter sp. GCM10027362 TaxID=3273379 RepID=UPI0036260A44